ncbi:NAD(P)H-binding protein [Streptomyces sulphureus]|uniref:NAD(P)H-binding protein n=1 Tax=Streptomyces sulphureus TaxID=47758 RepID=UPI00037A5370|nr:NAD(P)H-binding protein [Streptomyces sulphureus]
MSTDRKILVTGAAGQVGREVVKQLRAQGAPVRAGVRSSPPSAVPAGVETVPVDLTRPATLEAALDGVGKVFLYAVPGGTETFVRAAREAGVEQVVLLSSHTVVAGFPEQQAITAMHVEAEEAVKASGIPYTFLRPANFATNILMWGWPESIRTQGAIRFPYPESHSDAIHEADVAAVAAVALTQQGHEGRAYFVSGPESITQRRQLEALSRVLGRPLEFVELSEEKARAELADLIPEWVRDSVVGYWARSDGRPTELSDEVERLTGRPPRTFEEWAADHAADFRE